MIPLDASYMFSHMVNYVAGQLELTFSALSDSTRRAIVERLTTGKTTVKELARPFQISLPAISKHLKILEHAGLLTRTIEERTHHCELNVAPLKAFNEWLVWHQQFWEQRLDTLERYLQTSDQPSSIKELPS